MSTITVQVSPELGLELRLRFFSNGEKQSFTKDVLIGSMININQS